MVVHGACTMIGIATLALLTVFVPQSAYCSVCADAENSLECLQMMEMARMADLKAQILMELDMLDNNTAQVPDKHKYEYSSIIHGMEQQDGENDEQKDGVERVIVLAVDPYHGASPNALLAQFPVTKQTKQREVLQATLHVFLHLKNNPKNPTAIRIRVRETLPDGELGDEVAAETAIIQESGWVPIQLDPDHLRRWWNEEPITGLVVEALLDGRNVAVHPQNMDQPSENMFLSLLLRPIAPTRFRRQVTPVCTESMNETGCCLYDLYVDFVEFGWNFILAPQKFNARICRGECKKKEPSQAAHNSVVGNETISIEHITAKDLHCCHPTEYDPLKIVYLNQKNQITIARVEGMIAKKCSC
ncbi:transforming growth factor beta like domain protein [Oesophagostomum dentatum]|uniref:Transforming growth factor beta like domain protein n=1 Tax=Oesophagostomum dentatum TaxID=61180 RepID=A0A0B1TE72_OESDE|nr:transforming growth factor beta like domain protein [Oesophagostomum dentatum]